MRYAIIGDIHANLEALNAVTNDISGEGADRCFCVGDVVGYASNPWECIDRIKALAEVTVAGNHDWAAAGRLASSYFNLQARQAISWTAGHLESAELDFLSSLELVYRDEDFTLVHGTLDMPEKFNYMTDVLSSRESFSCLRNNICFLGHSHLPAVFIQNSDKEVKQDKAGCIVLEKGKKYIINVGSVGQPRDGDPRSCYCLYDSAKKEVRFRRVDYNVPAARKKIIEAGLPRFLGDRLLTGK
ncbi:MAG: metallophosphoesterase family protein [Candidatus Omnitrophota bacterium]|jgi:predicted phosphodiesterase